MCYDWHSMRVPVRWSCGCAGGGVKAIRLQDISVSVVTAGFVAVLVGVTSSIALVFQAAQAFGASPEQMTSWVWALGLGMGLCTAVPSLMLRKPVMVAWSTPGAAVLASAAAADHFTMQQAVGAFMLSAALTLVVGASGWFERIVKRIPLSIASALLAGVLMQFAMRIVTVAPTAQVLVFSMLLVYGLGRRWAPRYAVVSALMVGVAYVALDGQVAALPVGIQWAQPVWVTPEWTWKAAVGLALPLFVVTMASQNMPGVAVIRATGYDLPVSKLITMTGVTTLLLAPFGAFALNFSAITAAICMGPEAHENPDKRYMAAVCCGVLYIVMGLLAGAVVGVLRAFPSALIMVIAGLALLGAIGQGLSAALSHEADRDVALLTFLVTFSGITFMGVGSAFWGAVTGCIAYVVVGRRHA